SSAASTTFGRAAACSRRGRCGDPCPPSGESEGGPCVATISAGILAPAIIEISGLPALLLLLAPFVALLIVIARWHRPRPKLRPASDGVMLRAVPADGMEAPTPAIAGARPAPVEDPPVEWLARIENAERAGDLAALAESYL